MKDVKCMKAAEEEPKCLEQTMCVWWIHPAGTNSLPPSQFKLMLFLISAPIKRFSSLVDYFTAFKLHQTIFAYLHKV